MLVLLLTCGVALLTSLYVTRVNPPLHSTLTSSFQLIGTPVKLVDRAASRIVPVSTLDERELGDIFRNRYDAQVKPDNVDQLYLDALMMELKPFVHKSFPYRAYVIDDYATPNAMALPGGVILVTKALLNTLHSESELVAVLAHELGHIERGHCFDTVRFRLVSRKIGSDALGALADVSAQILLRHAYSKTIENEADEYAYALLVNSRYDPLGVGKSFGSLRRYREKSGATQPQHAEPIRDYFLSHPPLEIREAEFLERASVWWKQHLDERRYIGRQNLAERKELSAFNMIGEWKGGRTDATDASHALR